MRRWLIPILAWSALAALWPGSGLAAPSPKTRVQLRHTALGKLLVDGRGFTLYVFAPDPRNRDTCVKINGCISVWPNLKARGQTIAGRGVKRSLLASIPLPGGARQVTYAGHPLYGYVGDSAPGSTSYVGINQFGGAWYAINGAGKVVK